MTNEIACATFKCLCLALADFSVRSELLGATSLVRGLCLKESAYQRLLNLFYTSALDLRRASSH
jgi:hypothetical protein